MMNKHTSDVQDSDDEPTTDVIFSFKNENWQRFPLLESQLLVCPLLNSHGNSRTGQRHQKAAI